MAAVLGAIGLSGATITVGSLSEAAGAATPVTGAVRVGSPAFVPKWAPRLGPASPSSIMTVDVVLQPRDPAALASFATAVSTPGSSLYRHYLPAGAFPPVFGPLPQTISSVERWLRARGLRPGAISADHLIFHVTATVAQLEHAFSISIVRYYVDGRVAFANTEAPLFGGAVAGQVQGVVGLSNVVLAHSEQLLTAKRPLKPKVTPHVVTGGPQPCSAAALTGVESGAYTADQLAYSYSFSNLYAAGDLGAGQTVAIFELEPNLRSDVSAYQSCYGTSASVTYTKVDGGAGSGAGRGEAALDIEDVIGLAPSAAIDVYQGPNSDAGLLDVYSAITTADTAKVVSTSWGNCESQVGASLLNSENTIFQKAASQGQSVFAASGDNGSEDCYSNSLAVDDPSSQPFVTGVGGTTLSAIGPPPTQSVWNDSSIGEGAGGGCISEQWKMPTYQSGAPSSLNVINSDSSGTPCSASVGQYCREDPDVTADADPQDGYVIYYHGSWGGIGGTSAAAPLWAAFTALING